MQVSDDILALRIMLTHLCDGFSFENSNKSLVLSTRTKILYLLKEKDLTPIELINALCIAKSNLANLLKVMIQDGVVVSYKNLNNSKNIIYQITPQGLTELNEYVDSMMQLFNSKCKAPNEELSKSLTEIINLLKRN